MSRLLSQLNIRVDIPATRYLSTLVPLSLSLNMRDLPLLAMVLTSMEARGTPPRSPPTPAGPLRSLKATQLPRGTISQLTHGRTMKPPSLTFPPPTHGSSTLTSNQLRARSTRADILATRCPISLAPPPTTPDHPPAMDTSNMHKHLAILGRLMPTMLTLLVQAIVALATAVPAKVVLTLPAAATVVLSIAVLTSPLLPSTNTPPPSTNMPLPSTLTPGSSTSLLNLSTPATHTSSMCQRPVTSHQTHGPTTLMNSQKLALILLPQSSLRTLTHMLMITLTSPRPRSTQLIRHST